MTVYNVFIHFRNNIERVRNDSITNMDVARSQSDRCTESINSVHTVNN